MKNKNTPKTDTDSFEQVKKPKRSLAKNAAKVALSASVIAGGAAMYNKTERAEDKANAAIAEARHQANLNSARAQASFEEISELEGKLKLAQAINDAQAKITNDRLNEQKEVTDYLGGLTGLDSRQVAEHTSYPTLPELKGQFSPEVAQIHDAATVYLFKHFAGASEQDMSTPLNFACTAVKTGDMTLTSAAHCFQEIQEEHQITEDMPQKGGGYTPPDSYISEYIYFASDKPALTLGEAYDSAMQVATFNKDFINSDTAVLGLIDRAEERGGTTGWFHQIEPLKAMDSVPAPGTLARVSGYPSGSSEPVAAEGVVLGQMPASEFGFGYPSQITIVGINADVNDEYTCSFGASGETMVNQKGEWYGSLAFINRSDNPEGSLFATPSAQQIINMEKSFKTKLAGENYILCGFAPAMPEMQPLPLHVGHIDPAVSPEIYGK